MIDPVKAGRVLTYSEQFEGDYLESFHLPGPVTVTIEKIDAKNTVKSKSKKLIDKPILWFVGKTRGLVLNKTNGREIARMHGNDMMAWIGQKITILPTTCDAFGVEDTPCIRVKRGPIHIVAPV